ncbi:hypothetical protein B9Z52_16880 [Limnohabitans sp. Jir72]|nr:hypothetical protein B9Z52_16880 [Limnohabitans sp. Jir72]
MGNSVGCIALWSLKFIVIHAVVGFVKSAGLSSCEPPAISILQAFASRQGLILMHGLRLSTPQQSVRFGLK